jgi:hypothetical protein
MDYIISPAKTENPVFMGLSSLLQSDILPVKSYYLSKPDSSA